MKRIRRLFRPYLLIAGLAGAMLVTPPVARADVDNDRIVHEVWSKLCKNRGTRLPEFDETNCACLVGQLFRFTTAELRELYSGAARELLAGAKSEVVFSGRFDHLGFWTALKRDCPSLAQALERRDPEIGDRSFVLMPGSSRSKVNPISTFVDWYMEPFGDE